MNQLNIFSIENVCLKQKANDKHEFKTMFFISADIEKILKKLKKKLNKKKHRCQ